MLHIGMVAGESSGDILGAGLISAIQSKEEEVSFSGIGGEKMLEVGMKSLFPMEKLSVMGITEVLGRYMELSLIRKQLRDYFIENPPDVFIGIDAPDFNLWLEKELKHAGIKTIHYVSPSVWAWREYRVKKIRLSVDLILTLFPFEADFYDKHKIKNRFVGHPLANRLVGNNNIDVARKKLGLASRVKVIAILPGSRINEINRIAAPLLMAADKARQNYQDIHFVSSLPNEATYDRFVNIKQEVVPDLNIDISIGKAHCVMEASDIVLLASGTVALEAMLLGKPMVVAYRLSQITYLIVKALAKIPYASLPNILAGKKLVSECLQADCTGEKIFSELKLLIEDDKRINNLKSEFAKLSQQLKLDADELAANAVLDLIHAS